MPNILPLCVITSGIVKCFGAGGYHFNKGWVQSIAVTQKNLRFCVKVDGNRQIGHNSVDGIWYAKSVEDKERRETHTHTMLKVLPKNVRDNFINLSAYKEVWLEFTEVPADDEVKVDTCWIAPVHSKSKKLVFTHFFPRDIFVENFDKLREQDPLKLPAVKIKC
jgi:hypothetical protein